MNYITIFTTEQACNKAVSLNADGTLNKQPAAPVANAVAQTVPVADLESLKTILESISNTVNQTLSLGYVPGTENGTPYRVMTSANLESAVNSGQWQLWDHGVVDTHGVLYTSRTKKHFRFSNIIVFDKDTVPGMPAQLVYSDPISWWSAMCQLVPGLQGCGYLFLPSTSSRILLPDGTPATRDGGWHVFVQVHDSEDINRFGKELLIHSLCGEYGFMRPIYDSSTGQIGGYRPWSIFDPTTFTQERLLFEGSPVVSGGLQVKDSEVFVVPGEKLNTAAMQVDDAEARLLEAKTGLKIERAGGGMDCKLVDETTLHLDTVIETQLGPMTVQQYWDSDHGKLRCQATFRPDSNSWAGYLNRHVTGEPFLFDIGTHTKYTVSKEEKFFQDIETLQATHPVQHRSVGAAAVASLPTPEAQLMPPQRPFDVLTAEAEKLTSDDRERAVKLFMMAQDLGAMEANDLAKHYLTMWPKGTLEKAAREIRNHQRGVGQVQAQTQQVERTGEFGLLNIPPDTPLNTLTNFQARFIYVTNEHRYQDRLTGLSIRKEAFDTRYSNLMQIFFEDRVRAGEPIPRPSDVFSESQISIKVDDRSYWPGVDKDVVNKDTRVSLNEWSKGLFQTQIELLESL